jgi:hypothetical protein
VSDPGTAACSVASELYERLLTGHGLDPACAGAITAVYEPQPVALAVYGIYFGLTLLLEAPVYYAFFRRLAPERSGFVATLVTVNLATHPLVLLGFPAFGYHAGVSFGTTVACAELFAVAVEAVLLQVVFKWPGRSALAAAVCANLFSVVAGRQLLNLFDV